MTGAFIAALSEQYVVNIVCFWHLFHKVWRKFTIECRLKGLSIVMLRRAIIGSIMAALWAGGAAADKISVFAAASLRPALERIAADGDHDWQFAFAASSTLARQIEFGAPADLFVSANPDWVDYLATRSISFETRAAILSNGLVLAGRVDARPVPFSVAGLTRARDGGRIAVPLVDAVPLGQYAKAALQNLGLFDAIAPHLAQTDNAATARTLLETGAVSAAFLYASDVTGAQLSILHQIDPALHPDIRYIAISLTPRGDAVLPILQSEDGRAVFRSFGFRDVD